MQLSKHSLIRRQLLVGLALLAALLVIALGWVTIAQAHQNVKIGDYVVEYGWVSEPAVVGQPNAVVINFSLTSAPTTTVDVDISALQIQAVFGGQTKVLTLQPLAEDTHGQFIAPMTPMRPGKYTFHLSGNIGSTTFNNDVQPEEVQTADVVQFPSLDAATSSKSSSSLGVSGWLGIAGIVLGVVGIGLGAYALARKPKA